MLKEINTETNSHEQLKASPHPQHIYVSVGMLSHLKGQSHWQPGYQVVSSPQGGLRLTELTTGKLIRVNQYSAREIPAYDEIDPIPPQTCDCLKALLPMEAQPVVPPREQNINSPSSYFNSLL